MASQKRNTDLASHADESKHGIARPLKRRRADRGLPSPKSLRELAKTYLLTQSTLWPELVKEGVFGPADESTLESMCEEFRRRFRGECQGPASPSSLNPAQSKLACSYLRYSCDRSNPRSLDQQLKLQLDKARASGQFIPWSLVFADAAVTATTADRTGYKLAKSAIELEVVETLYIDEVGRVSRDTIETLKLGRLVEKVGKRLIGVSDGFDSATPHSKMMLSIFAMLHEWFIDQLKSKVNRGMDDAFDRGTNIHSPSVGYRLEPAMDIHGRPIFGRDGEQLKTKVVDPAEAKAVAEAFQLFVESHWSPLRIARLFNDRMTGGLRSWDASTIKQLLRRRTYVGIEIYRRTYRERDPETGRSTIRQRPRSEWKVRRQRQLQIIPWKTWKAAQQKLDLASEAWKGRRIPGKPSRTSIYPSILIRPICGICHAELTLGRSGRYSSYCCSNGINRRHGCTFRGYKRVGIVESTILGHLREAVFTEEFVAQVRDQANRYLEVLARQPRADTSGIRSKIREHQTKRNRLVTLLEGDEDARELKAIVEKLKSHEHDLALLRKDLLQLEAQNTPPPPPIEKGEELSYLTNLRELLTREVSEAAPIVSALTGPITVEQVTKPGESKPSWIAHFRVNLVAVAVELAKTRNCPMTQVLEYLHKRGWTTAPIDCRVDLEGNLRSIKISARAIRMAIDGADLKTITESTGVTWEVLKEAIEVSASIPELPNRGRPGESLLTARRVPLYQGKAEEVAAIRHSEGISFGAISERLGIHVDTVREAYDWSQRANLPDELEAGRRQSRGNCRRADDRTRQEIYDRLAAGEREASIASAVGCSVGTVKKVRRQMNKPS